MISVSAAFQRAGNWEIGSVGERIGCAKLGRPIFPKFLGGAIGIGATAQRGSEKFWGL